MLENAWIIPLLPAVSFVLILFFGKRLPFGGAEIGVAALSAAFVLTIVAGVQWIDRPNTITVEHVTVGPSAHADEIDTPADTHAPADEPVDEHEAEPADHGAEAEHAIVKRAPVEREWSWFDNGQIHIKAGILVDGFTIAMLFVVTLISLLVHIFSTNYMHGDKRFTYFFAALSLFTTGMLVLITASNTLQALFGWELMGLCSFMLIGHWWEEQKNSDAALKAFFTTRTGDIGLLVGMSVLFFGAGQTFNITKLNEAATTGSISRTVLVAGAAALLVAVIGKSAQFPLHTWLPDAMAGPTPVSALIHAATMVVAGVYLVARLYPVFFSAFDIGGGGMNAVAVVGGITVVIAAALAFVQDDIKKVLAYSTVSQLGYMVMALGVGGWTAGVFHLFTHAMFKGLLFLGSGSVSHAVHSFDMKAEMGGLRKFMPISYGTFMIGSLALAGVFPLAGFWSKDEILLAAGEGGYQAFLIVGLVGAAMTAAYMTRCVYLTFFGEYRGHGHPHESPIAITGPLVVLAGMSVIAGFANAVLFGIGAFGDIVEPAYVSAIVTHHEASVSLAIMGSLAAFIGIGGAYWYYFARGAASLGILDGNGAARGLHTVLVNKYYLDDLYEGVIVKGIREPISNGVYWFNQNVLDGIIHGVAAGARGLSRFVYEVIDQKGVDGLVNATGAATSESGGFLRHLQTGKVQDYAAFLFGAAGVIALALVLLTT
ncbi:MAG: NADH-quinone oxidoreductase subunit 5 family protein [Acidimicrobiales bacterium]